MRLEARVAGYEITDDRHRVGRGRISGVRLAVRARGRAVPEGWGHLPLAGESEATRELMAPEGWSEATRELMAPEGWSEATRELMPESLRLAQ
jgi:hypothetical protein